MKRALYVGAFIPDEKAPHAGGQAAFRNRADLESDGYVVTSLICTTEPNVRVNTSGRLIFRQTSLSLVIGFFNNMIRRYWLGMLAWPLLDTRAHVGFEKALQRELQTGNYDLVYADFTQALLPTLRAVSGLTGKRPYVHGCVHDLYVQKLIRDQSFLARSLLGVVIRIERMLLQKVDEVITLSEKDQYLTKALYDCEHVSVKTWTPPFWVRSVSRTPEGINQGELLFFANFKRPENLEAVRWFLQNAWPQIKAKMPFVGLTLAGAGSDDLALSHDCESVRCIGYLENPGEVFARCHVAIAPLALGAGVKFKVLEALACGAPVIGTAIGLEGVARGPAVFEASRDRFAEVVCQFLLHDEIGRERNEGC
jgi:glycosyltransferase involved in cell wall biosynthesis